MAWRTCELKILDTVSLRCCLQRLMQWALSDGKNMSAAVMVTILMMDEEDMSEVQME